MVDEKVAMKAVTLVCGWAVLKAVLKVASKVELLGHDSAVLKAEMMVDETAEK